LACSEDEGKQQIGSGTKTKVRKIGEVAQMVSKDWKANATFALLFRNSWWRCRTVPVGKPLPMIGTPNDQSCLLSYQVNLARLVQADNPA
jgi:hypothetical protein